MDIINPNGSSTLGTIDWRKPRKEKEMITDGIYLSSFWVGFMLGVLLEFLLLALIATLRKKD